MVLRSRISASFTYYPSGPVMRMVGDGGLGKTTKGAGEKR
jgi:hypothetical protein